MRLTELLDIDVNSKKIISVVGGGGKTSLIFRLAEELAEQGKKVIVTTTTHIAFEPERPFARDGELNKVRGKSQKVRLYGSCLYGKTGRKKLEKAGKYSGILRYALQRFRRAEQKRKTVYRKASGASGGAASGTEKRM